MKIDKLTLISLMLFSVIIQSCKKSDNDYFNGKLVLIDDITTPDTLEGKRIDLFTDPQSMAVYDTIAIVSSTRFTDYQTEVFSLNSFKCIGRFFRLGNGPGEVLTAGHSHQYEVRNNALYLWVTINDRSFQPLNISESLKRNSQTMDTTYIRLSWMRSLNQPYMSVFSVNENTYIAGTYSEPIYYNDYKNYKPTEYRLIDIKNDSVVKTITVYKKSILSNCTSKLIVSPDQYIGFFDRIKPDKTKIAMSMLLLSQINIIDLQSGEIKGIRIKGTPDFSYLEGNCDNFILFHKHLTVDNDYIYVPYVKLLYNYGRALDSEGHLVHIYNWGGDLVKSVYLRKAFNSITVDPVKKLIYAHDNEDNIYCYNPW